MKRLPEKLTYSNVVATLALFIALGGSAYAIGAGTIGSREVRDNSLGSRDIRNQSLTARDVDERALRARPRVYRRSITTGVPRGTLGSRQVDCNRGDLVLSGGVNPIGSFQDPGVEQLYGAPAQGGGGFQGVLRYGFAGAAGSYGLQVYVICAGKPRR